MHLVGQLYSYLKSKPVSVGQISFGPTTVRGDNNENFAPSLKHVLTRIVFEKVDKDLICMGPTYDATQKNMMVLLLAGIRLYEEIMLFTIHKLCLNIIKQLLL